MSEPFVECQTVLAMLDANLDQLRKIAEEFPEEKLWERPRPEIVSLGNLICHVAGSMRDWLENGMAGGDWERDRAAEFQREGSYTRQQVLEHLDKTRRRCQPLLDAIDAETWTAPRQFRGKSFTVREILLHQLVHTAYHAGQAAFLRWLVGGLEPKSL